MLKRLLCGLMLLLAGATLGIAQQVPTTQGKEFWLSFMRNGYRSSTTTSYNHLTLIASAKHACTLTVTNSYTGYTNNFSVPDQGVHTLQIPDAQGYNDQQYGLANKGLLVTSTDTVSLYIANETQNSYDAANVLPVQALGCRYMVQSNKSLGEQSGHVGDNRASFLIVATEDNTVVQITPSCMTWESHGPGESYTVTLQRGQCYHVLNKNAGEAGNIDGDFSGTLIESLDEKPIAVFNGNSCTSVADGSVSEGLDHVFEQAMPVDNWGTHFVLTKTATPSAYSIQNDRVKITALFDNTVVRRGDGSQLCRLGAGGSYAFWMTETSAYLESTNPIAVYLYNHSHSSSNTYGDPSMVWISPVEQNLREVIFSTFTSTTPLNHFVNVVCYTEDAAELYLNDTPIASSQIHAVPDAPQFSYARVPVSPGMNRLSCPGGLVAHVYGMGDRQGYAYTVGSSARILTNQLLVNGDPVMDEYVACQFEMLDFRMETNYLPDLVTWNFDDGSPTEQGVEVSHAFDKPGHFYVEAVVDHEVNGEPQSDTLRATIHVNPMIEWTVTDTACMEYEWFDTIRYESGTYRVLVHPEDGCDSLYILHLTIGQPPENPERTKYSCSAYHWHGILCENTDTYTHPFETAEHCVYDSILHFTRIPAEDHTYVVDTCDQYEWLGRVYREMGHHVYDTVIVGEGGCESHLTLDLTLQPSPPFERIEGLTQVAVATTFWPGMYNYYLDDSIGMITSRIRWELMANPEGPGQWELIPHGASCTVIAYSMGEKILWVTTGDGFCDREAFKTINCTGYGVDDNEWTDLEVYPNPVSDELVVKGPEMLELTVYNLLGQPMRKVAAKGDTELKVEVKGLPQALYLLEIRTSRGNITRLISVIK